MLKFVRSFQTSAARRIDIGSKVPSALLQNGAPSITVNLAEVTTKGKHLVVGVPGAFSPGCSQRHIPEYIKAFTDLKSKGVAHLYVVAVNDSFVTSAWKRSLFSKANKPEADSFVTILADPQGSFTKEWDLLFDATNYFGNDRSRRYAALIEDGLVSKVFVENDNTGIDVSAAAKVIKEI